MRMISLGFAMIAVLVVCWMCAKSTIPDFTSNYKCRCLFDGWIEAERRMTRDESMVGNAWWQVEGGAVNE